eukprot:5293435-Pleurochrysis_carterae.AAC.1
MQLLRREASVHQTLAHHVCRGVGRRAREHSKLGHVALAARALHHYLDEGGGFACPRRAKENVGYDPCNAVQDGSHRSHLLRIELPIEEPWTTQPGVVQVLHFRKQERLRPQKLLHTQDAIVENGEHAARQDEGYLHLRKGAEYKHVEQSIGKAKFKATHADVEARRECRFDRGGRTFVFAM